MGMARIRKYRIAAGEHEGGALVASSTAISDWPKQAQSQGSTANNEATHFVKVVASDREHVFVWTHADERGKAIKATRSLVVLEVKTLGVVGFLSLSDESSDSIFPCAASVGANELYLSDDDRGLIFVWNKLRLLELARMGLVTVAAVPSQPFNPCDLLVRQFPVIPHPMKSKDYRAGSLAWNEEDQWLLALAAQKSRSSPPHLITRFNRKGVPLQILPFAGWNPINISLGLGQSKNCVFVLCDNGPTSLNVYGYEDESVHVLKLKDLSNTTAGFKDYNNISKALKEFEWQVEGATNYGHDNTDARFGAFPAQWMQRTLEAAFQKRYPSAAFKWGEMTVEISFDFQSSSPIATMKKPSVSETEVVYAVQRVPRTGNLNTPTV